MDAGEELEGEALIADLKLQIALRDVFTRFLSAAAQDEAAYRRTMDSLMGLIGLDAIAVAYYEGWRSLVLLSSAEPGSPPRPLLRDEARALAEASRGGEGRCPCLGPGIARSMVIPLEVEGDNCGYVALGRASRGFPAGERGSLVRVFEVFAAWARMRKEQARQESIRREAERALLASEERLRTFFEESKDMIYSANAEDVVSFINDAGLELLGIANRYEIVGRPFAGHLLSPGDRSFMIEKLREQGFVTDYECVYKRSDGSSAYCIETARAVKDGEGRIVEVQGIVKDISDRIASERELWKANLELVEANEKLRNTQMLMVQQEKLASIGHLAAGVAHEINNPLGFLSSNQATLSGYLRACREAWAEAFALDPERHAAIAKRLDLDYILEESGAIITESDEGFKRIIDIVQSLKNFARADSRPVMGSYDLNEGIRSTLVVARNEVKYVADVELSLEPMLLIRALGSEINQVCLNILVNAAQAIASQGRKEKGKILVSTRLEGDWAVVEFADDGPGIPEDMRLKVFDPFFTTKPVGKGTGLGLSITYDIVTRKHGGTVLISDSKWGGALFTLTLPVDGPPDEGGEGAGPGADPPLSAPAGP